MLHVSVLVLRFQSRALCVMLQVDMPRHRYICIMQTKWSDISCTDIHTAEYLV